MENIIKLLFLDVDGVLNSHLSPSIVSLSKGKLKLLEHIKNSTHAHIILSSSWRNHPWMFNRLVRVLGYRGMVITTHTPSLESNIRGEEIAVMLERFQPDKYAILDDNNDMLEDQLPSFFQTDGTIGLTKEIADKVILHLGHHDD